MANDVLLNNIDHKELKIMTGFSEKFGDKVQQTPTFPLEFRTLQGEYPIFFQKSVETGQFYPVALLGFEQGENLYLEGETWKAGYVPLMIKRQPFLIGAQHYMENGKQQQRLMIHVDLDNPRVNEIEGQPLFEEFGANSPYLDQVASMLEAIDVGMKSNDDFMRHLLELDLIESVTLDIQLENGSRNSLVGFYTVQEDNLNRLSTEQIGALHDKGYLQSIYMVMASQSNITKLVELKNKRIAKLAAVN